MSDSIGGLTMTKFQQELKIDIQRLIDACTWLAVMCKAQSEVDKQNEYVKTLEVKLESLISQCVPRSEYFEACNHLSKYQKALELACNWIDDCDHATHPHENMGTPPYWIDLAEKENEKTLH